MRIDGNGYARELTHAEMHVLLYQGFNNARDRLLFALCFYTACRISEARQMHLIDAFVDGWHSDVVRSAILLRKENTKGKQGTRTIPTHPDLARFLQEYRRDALHLLALQQDFGHWNYRNLNEDGKIVALASIQCPRCGSTKIKRDGQEQGHQRYGCKECHYRPREHHILKTDSSAQAPTTRLYDPRGVFASTNYGFLFANPNNPFLFPGLKGQGCLSLDAALERFEFAFEQSGIIGAGSHSGRRTALTRMHREGILLRVIQAISGHKQLENLQTYLEVTANEVSAAINVLD
ncbi:MAG: tyrosine-type recombinase/integrase [Lyngbya sp. HA4199-MV5]|jgi:integrase|nr:tyrosine-type recombinase/integrase [Lyngbya sp. HA4199-MV5]